MLIAIRSRAGNSEDYVVGNPKGFLEGTFSHGLIKALRQLDVQKLFRAHCTRFKAGNSGGTVLNDKSEVIGVAVAQVKLWTVHQILPCTSNYLTWRYNIEPSRNSRNRYAVISWTVREEVDKRLLLKRYIIRAIVTDYDMVDIRMPL